MTKKKTKAKKVKKVEKTRHTFKTRKIEVPDFGHNIVRKSQLSLPALIEWCGKQEDIKHQAITAWLIAARDGMDVLTMAAIKQSQIDSRKKDR